eukprot:g63789.t1
MTDNLPLRVRLAMAKYGSPPLPGNAQAAKGDAGGGKGGKQKGGMQQGQRNAPVVQHPDSAEFGDLVICQSQYTTSRTWTEVGALNASLKGQTVWVRSRVHSTRGMGKVSFMVLRSGFFTVQVVADSNEGLSKDATKYVAKLPPESVVDLCGEVRAADVKSCSQSDVELHVKKIFAVSVSEAVLPFKIDDASNPPPSEEEIKALETKKEEEAKQPPKKLQPGQKPKEDSGPIYVGQDTRLDNRWMDLRTPANHAIFRIQGAVCRFFRDYFDKLGFVEIHTPKLIPGVSEGGASVFKTKYFDRTACLAQSPQLYKQMAVVSDLFKVYEIGPVFRAEDSNTHRHMCEFMGMDFEMAFKEHYHEVLSVLANLFVYMFDCIAQHCQPELASIKKQYGVEPLKYNRDTLVLDYKEAVEMLRAAGEEVPADDFNTANEKKLGQLVMDKYQTQLYIVDKWPVAARPFYTMPDPLQPGFTNSYDVFLRGEEITSGAQRIHEPELLKKRATECGIPIEGLQKYIDSFKFGAFPHAGAGIGLERVVMLYLGLDNIRKTSMFPRTPKRLEP